MRGPVASFLRVLFRRRRFEDGLSEELRFHVDAYAADLMKNGVPPEEAARQARAAFGGMEAAREECRQAKGARTLDRLRQDLMYSVRLMRRAPAFTAAAIVAIGLGIGVNTAIFTLIDGVLLRKLPVTNPDELYFLAHGNGDTPSVSSNYPLLERYRHASEFSGITAFLPSSLKVDSGGAVEGVSGQFVSGNYHVVVGAPMELGRGFAAEPDAPGHAAPVAVISDHYWTRKFGRAPEVLGRTLTIDGRAVQIVGVTSKGFTGFVPGGRFDITLPLSVYALANPTYLTLKESFRSMSLVGRLAPGITANQALVSADVIFQRFMADPEVAWARRISPDAYSVARLLPAARGGYGLRQRYRVPLLAMMGLAVLVLLVASANVANLLLARASTRSKEVAIRLCVGGNRSRIIRQFLTESAVLALIGGALGVFLAYQGTGLIVALFSSWQHTLVLDIAPNVRVLAFATAVAVATGLAFGIAPALRATSLDLTPALKGALRFRGARQRPLLSRGLVVGQIALCTVVVVVAALLAQTVSGLKAQAAGFDRTSLLLLNVDTSATSLTNAERRSLYETILERLDALPGVTSVSLSTMTPLNTSGSFRGLALPNLPETHEARGVFANIVSEDYFRTLGMRMVRGRVFNGNDLSGNRPTAILNARTAAYVFGDADPIGRTIAWMSAPDQRIEIVGVVEDASHATLREAPPRMVYTPLISDEAEGNLLQVAVRSSPGNLAITGGIRDALRDVDRRVVVSNVRTMEEQLDGSLVTERALSRLSAGFAVLASLLAWVGLYGVVSYHVARQTRSIGIRLALGAPPRTILGGVMAHAMMSSIVGVALGLIGASMAARSVSAILYGLSASDPLTLAASSVALIAISLVSAYLPARRAARINPLQAIRTE